MTISKFLSKCHDIYTLECTDEYETQSFMVGRVKYILTELTYPESSIHILDSDGNLIFNGPSDSLLSVKEDKYNLYIKVKTNSGERIITLRGSTGSEPY